MSAAFESNGAMLNFEMERWLEAHVAGYRGPGIIQKFAFGQSNPTYLLATPGARYVVRRKPEGALLRGAHAIDREYRILGALAGSAVPVPRTYAFCSDPTILGVPFFVMEMVHGRIFYDQRMQGLSPTERSALFDAMNETIARIHSIDPMSVGLGDYGRPDAFLRRQLATWTRQYRATESGAIPAMECLMDWLPEHLPPEVPVRIFHGDLRLDNMIFHPTEPRVIAVIDWELSTLGDPVADFAHHALVWRVDAALFRGLRDLDLGALGIPKEVDYVRRYAERCGIDVYKDWKFYLAFAMFRLAAILQTVWQRAMTGNACSTDAADVGARSAPLAEIGWQIAQGIA